MFSAALKPSQRRFISFFSSILLVAGLLAFGASSASAANNAHITGTVTMAGGGGAVGVDVQLFEYDADEDFWFDSDHEGAVTGAGGTYDIGGLPAGTYRVGFALYDPDFVPTYYPHSDFVDNATSVTVATGGTKANVNTQLATAGHITGTVTKSGGTPLEGIAVQTYVKTTDSDDEVNWDYFDGGYAFSEADGTYEVGGLPAGTYRLDFEDWSENPIYVGEFYDNTHDFDSATEIVVAAGATVAGKNAELEVGGKIKGKVTDPGGIGAPDVDVTAYVPDGDGGWDYFTDGYTNSAGNYTLGGLAAGTYRVDFNADDGSLLGEAWNDKPTVEEGDDIVVASGATVLGKNAQLASGSHITGKVTKTGGTAVGDASVTVYQHVDDEFGSYWDQVGFAQTESDGTYDVGGLSAGTYRLGFEDNDGVLISEFFDNKPDVESATDIVVGSDVTVPNKNAELAVGGHIKGKVTKDGTTGIPDISVQVMKKVTVDGDTYWDYVGEADTDSDGTYDVGGLPSGTYHVGFQDFDEVWVTEFYNNAPTIDAGTNVVVTAPGTTSNINATLVKGGKITGTVTLPAGITDPDSELYVAAYNLSTGALAGETGADTDDGNTYSLSGLATGSYRVEFARASGSSLAAAQFYNGKQESAGKGSATAVPVTAGATKTGINASLSMGGKIKGTVVDGGGDPVPDCGVFAFTSDGKFVTRSGYTDDSGDFTVGGLTSGGYKLVVGGPGECDGQARYYVGSNGVLSSDSGSASTIPVTMGATVTLAHELVDADPSSISNSVLPTISGTPTVGATLTSTQGTWIAPVGTTFARQWLADGVNIAGATATTYKPVAGDVGKKISVKVTGAKSGLESVSATSTQTAAVTTVPPNVKTSAKITVDGAGKSKINVACVKACDGYLQVWSDAAGTLKSGTVHYTVGANAFKSYALTGVSTTATAGAKARVSQTSPIVGSQVQLNNLEIVRAAGNLLKTSATVTVDPYGKGKVNVSCSMACSGYAQVWSDGTDAGSKSSVFHYSLSAAGFQSMSLTGLKYVDSPDAKVRLSIVGPAPFPGESPQFNPITLVKGLQNVVKTSATGKVTSAGKTTLNLSCSMACEGYAQVWTEAEGIGPKSVAVHYKLTAAGYVPLTFTGLPYAAAPSAKVRISASQPATGGGVTFNALNLSKG